MDPTGWPKSRDRDEYDRHGAHEHLHACALIKVHVFDRSSGLQVYRDPSMLYKKWRRYTCGVMIAKLISKKK